MKRLGLLLVVVGCSGGTKYPATAPPGGEPVSADELELPAKRPSDLTSVVLAETFVYEGGELAKQGKWAEASAKFREAVARVPEAKWFFDLCVSLYVEAKFDDAMLACEYVAKNQPTPALQRKTDRMIGRIKKVNR